ncbi:MAG: nuclear transport factor 2 family protein [Rhizobiaceae bacterium]|nr:nuclear transport factor 2 family protein [Rhizobiaceae bacterium]
MTVETELRAAEAALYDAMVRKDVGALERMLHKDLIFVHSTALVEDRPTYLASVAANRYKYESIVPRPGATIRVYGDFALISGEVDMNTTLHVQVVLGWVRENGRWLLVLRHAAKIPSA